MNYEQFDIQFVQIYILCITANAHSYIRVNEFCFRRKEISKNSPRPFIQKSLLLLILYENMDIPFLGRLFRGIPLAWVSSLPKNERVSHTFGNYWKCRSKQRKSSFWDVHLFANIRGRAMFPWRKIPKTTPKVRIC